MAAHTRRSLAASIGALERWSRATSPETRREATAPARRGLRARFARQIDPDGTVPAAELEAAIDRALQAHMRRLSLKAAATRAARAARGGRAA